MKITVDSIYIRELAYQMLRDIQDGRFKENNNGTCIGMLNVEESAALDQMMIKLLMDLK